MGNGLIKEKKKAIAEESQKTKKARAKLMQKLDAIEKKITPQALEKKTIEIHRWIEKYAAQRTILRSKTISLFDENQNTAKLSKKVAEIAEEIQKEIKLQFAPPKEGVSKNEDVKKLFTVAVSIPSKSGS